MSNYQTVPQVFKYRGMMCECINLHVHDGPPKTMTVRIYPTRTTKVLDLLESVPNDPLFEFLIAFHYHLTVIGRIQPLMKIDEVHHNLIITMTFKVAYDTPMFRYHCNEVPLFDNNLGRPSFRDTFMHTHEDVHRTDDPEESVNITLQTTVTVDRAHGANTHYNMGSMTPWGMQIDVDVTNLNQVSGILPGYRPGVHEDIVLEDIYDAFEIGIKHISHSIDPLHLIDIGYDYYIISSRDNMSRRGITYFIAIYPTVFNGIEVRAINHQHIVFRPDSDSELLSENAHNIDWNQVYRKAEELIMTLYSTDGALVIAKALDHSIVYENGEPFFDVRLLSDAAPFTSPALTLPSGPIVENYRNSNFGWIAVDLMSQIDYITDKIQIILPVSAQERLYDKRALMYMRMPLDSFINKDSTVHYILDKFNTNEFRVDLVAESRAWISFRITSVEDDPVYDDTDVTWAAIGRQILPSIKFDSHAIPCNEAIEFIVGMLFTSDMLTAYIDVIPERIVKFYSEKFKWTADRFGLFMYETAVNIHDKSWHGVYDRVLDIIYTDDRGMNVSATEEQTETATVTDDTHQSIDDTPVEEHEETAEIEHHKEAKPNLIQRIFGD